ncbi:hypothetical protein [Bacteroidetes bacterium endosymbiont of Geopemphigus sp.]|uniref:hypothetical protein n=1 Tax=Bacteroidetes bacterium endosymbiont of Geopemphigus sp. TaxID=2047937 RepID=UPI000CD1E768|nr:hypothetical protein [Bacteroidetes bacterium endosymbiont of Geopemphigus sp.]
MNNHERLAKLEAKLSALLEAYQTQKHEIGLLREKSRKLKHEFKGQLEENIKLKETNELLKTANAILGNQEYKKLMKSRISLLIREIDRSINQIKM